MTSFAWSLGGLRPPPGVSNLSQRGEIFDLDPILDAPGSALHPDQIVEGSDANIRANEVHRVGIPLELFVVKAPGAEPRQSRGPYFVPKVKFRPAFRVRAFRRNATGSRGPRRVACNSVNALTSRSRFFWSRA